MSPNAALVWSDFILGAASLTFAVLSYFYNRRAAPIFFFASASALTGGIYHYVSYAHTSQSISLLWLFVELLLVTSAVYLIIFAAGRPPNTLVLSLTLAFCAAFIFFVSQDFTWVALLQTVAACFYGLILLITHASSTSKIYFILYVAITAISAWQTIPASANRTDQRLTTFHILEVAAVLFLYMSTALVTPVYKSITRKHTRSNAEG